MDDDPFFSVVSAPSDVKTTIAKTVVSEKTEKTSNKNRDKSDKKGKLNGKMHGKERNSKEHRKTDSKFEKSKNSRIFDKSDNKPKKHVFHEEIHEKYKEIKRPPHPPHYEKKPKYVDPRFRPPSMLNDIAFPKPIKINPNAPPGSFKIFSSKVPDVPVHAELYP